MDPGQLQKLYDKYADQRAEMHEDFVKLFRKWFKKSPRLAAINMIQLPMSLIINVFLRNDTQIMELIPELPDYFISFMKPFEIIKDQWGKIPNEDFEKLYRQHYEAQSGKKI